MSSQCRLRFTLPCVFLLVSLVCAVVPAFAQSPADPNGDDIEQVVLRISWVNGDASFQRGDEPGRWQPLGVNVPMTIGDRLYTADSAKLELQSPNLRIFVAPGTELTALNLTEDVQQLSIAEGTLTVRVSRYDDGDAYEIDTPNAAVTLERAGLYRIYVDENGNTTVAVRRGGALVASAGGEVSLKTGEEMQIDGIDEPTYETLALPLADSWDRWVDSRERRTHTVESYDYVSNDIVGVEDLEDNGRWEETPEYGRVWSPTTVAADWAPYRFGRWFWQDPWGWTWIADESWGWAPFHYGRWVNRSSRWCWVPVGPSVRHVSYSPALVAFVGGGPGWSASISAGGAGFVGWFPLGPRDPFSPWWGRRAAVNPNLANAAYANRAYATVVNRSVFGSGAPVRTGIVRDAAALREIQKSPVVRGPLPILPTETSLRISAAPSRAVPQPRGALLTRPVAARLAPPTVPPAFSTKVAAIRGSGGAPVTPGAASRLSLDENRGARAAVPIRPVLSEDRRMILSPRPSAQGELPPNPAGAPAGRVPALPSTPFIARPRGGPETPDRTAPGAVAPWPPRRVQQPARIEERMAPASPEPQRVVPPQSKAPLSQPHWAAPPSPPERAMENAPQRLPYAIPPRRVAPAPPDPLKERPVRGAEPSEKKG